MYQAVAHWLFQTHNYLYYENNGLQKRKCAVCGVIETLQWTEDKWDWIPGAETWVKDS
jgi:hypothetical protein